MVKASAQSWEQRKLGEVVYKMYNGQTPSRANPNYWNGSIPWICSGELNRSHILNAKEHITEEGKNSAHLQIMPKGTLLIAITGLEAPGTRGNCGIIDFDTTINQSCMALIPVGEVLETEFLFQWYRLKGEKFGIRITQGTKQQSYNAELLSKLPIELPSIVEQRQISSTLSKVDNLITLHQRNDSFHQNLYFLLLV